MASGVINAQVRMTTFEGTTDANGNVNISNSSIVVFIAQVLDASSGGTLNMLGIPFIFKNGKTYLHVTKTDGTAVTNQAVSGTYWYR